MLLALLLLSSVSVFKLSNNNASGYLFASRSGNGGSLTAESQAAESSTAQNSTNTSFWYVGAATIDESFNQGVRSLILVKSQSLTTGVLSFWIAEAFQDNLWAQAGYYIQNGSQPIAFYQVWSLNSRTELATGTAAVSLGFHEFAIENERGTIWQFTLDSKVFGSFNIGTKYTNPSYPIYAMSEEGYVPTPFAFSQVIFSRAIQIFNLGTWRNARTAVSFGNGWGIGGYSQIAQLSADEAIVGGSMAAIDNNARLW